MENNYDLNKESSVYLNEESSYKELSEYFSFLVLQEKERCKSSSGSLKVVFRNYPDALITVELYGYDTLTLSSIECVEGKTEGEVKRKVVAFFEKERLARIQDNLEYYE